MRLLFARTLLLAVLVGAVCVLAQLAAASTAAHDRSRGFPASHGSDATAALTATPTLAETPTPTGTATPEGLVRVGRWFLWNGQYSYLVGIDSQELAANPAIAYEAKLDQIAAAHLNKVRIWIDAYFGGTAYLHPWLVTGGKYDLDTWDTTYWSRLAAFVSAARDRGIVVEATIFEGNGVSFDAGVPSSWPMSAWNKRNNTNSVFTGATTATCTRVPGCFIPQFFTLNYTESGKNLTTYQQALLAKTVDTIGGYDNVYLEVANEFPNGGGNIDTAYPWQNHWIDALRALTSVRPMSVHAHTYVGNHINGVSHWWDNPKIDVLNFTFTNDPAIVASLLHTVQPHGKILQQNEGGYPWANCVGGANAGHSCTVDSQCPGSSCPRTTNIAGSARGAWAWLMSGGYSGMYVDDATLIGDTTFTAAASYLAAVRTIAETAHFEELSPIDATGAEFDTLVTSGPLDAAGLAAKNWQVLARPGSRYLVYFWGSSSTTSVVMTLPTGPYRYSWYDDRTATAIATGTVTSTGGATEIPAPATAAWDATIGTTLVVTIPSSTFPTTDVLTFTRTGSARARAPSPENRAARRRARSRTWTPRCASTPMAGRIPWHGGAEPAGPYSMTSSGVGGMR